MSRTGDCWDNAPVESFFRSFKTEASPDQPDNEGQNMRQHQNSKGHSCGFGGCEPSQPTSNIRGHFVKPSRDRNRQETAAAKKRRSQELGRNYQNLGRPSDEPIAEIVQCGEPDSIEPKTAVAPIKADVQRERAGRVKGATSMSWSGERASGPLTRPARSRRIERRSDGAD